MKKESQEETKVLEGLVVQPVEVQRILLEHQELEVVDKLEEMEELALVQVEEEEVFLTAETEVPTEAEVLVEEIPMAEMGHQEPF